MTSAFKLRMKSYHMPTMSIICISRSLHQSWYHLMISYPRRAAAMPQTAHSLFCPDIAGDCRTMEVGPGAKFSLSWQAENSNIITKVLVKVCPGFWELSLNLPSMAEWLSIRRLSCWPHCATKFKKTDKPFQGTLQSHGTKLCETSIALDDSAQWCINTSPDPPPKSDYAYIGIGSSIAIRSDGLIFIIDRSSCGNGGGDWCLDGEGHKLEPISIPIPKEIYHNNFDTIDLIRLPFTLYLYIIWGKYILQESNKA